MTVTSERKRKRLSEFGIWLYGDSGIITVNNVVDYLDEYLDDENNFINIHTRRDICKMLNILHPYKDVPFGGYPSYRTGKIHPKSCKRRLVKHLRFYMELHNRG